MRAWNPFEEVEAMRREFARALGQTAQAAPSPFRAAFLPARAARAYPLLNLHEDADNYYVEALAPGVDPASFEVSVLRDRLTLSGEKKPVNDGVKPEAFHRSERAAGRFVRTIDVPSEVDGDKVSADYRDGVLTVTLPKAAAAKPRQIRVLAN